MLTRLGAGRQRGSSNFFPVWHRARYSHASPPENTVVIPGPLRSFLRMAGISQQISADDVLPLVARNAYATGYINGVPTEYLRLLDRYLHQARELQMLAGSGGTIRVSNCAEAEPLLSILGYHARPACGQKGSTLATARPGAGLPSHGFGLPADRVGGSAGKARDLHLRLS